MLEGVLDLGVLLADGSIYPAELIGEDRGRDLVVLKTQIPREKLNPLLNTRGEVIGVNTVTIIRRVGKLDYGALGVGFTIPSSLAARHLPEMIAGPLLTRP